MIKEAFFPGRRPRFFISNSGLVALMGLARPAGMRASRLAPAWAASGAGRGRVTQAVAASAACLSRSRRILRQLNAGDVQEASEAAERLVSTATGELALVTSPARMGQEMLRRRVAMLEDGKGGKFDGPLEPQDMARLTVTDLCALQIGVAILDAHVEKAVEAMGKRGRSAAGSAAPADSGSAAGQPE